MYLSERDETAIGGYVPLTKFLTQEQYGINITENECKRIREKSFENVKKIYHKYGSPHFATLWNYNIVSINQNGLNEMLRIVKLRPFANVIRCFQREELVQMGGEFRRYNLVSFGIKRQTIEQYRVNKERAERMGCKYVLPVMGQLTGMTKEKSIFGEATIKIENDRKVKIARNALYNQFTHWCALEGVSEEQGLQMALKQLLKDYPSKELGSVEAYKVCTDIDRRIFTKETTDVRVEERVIFSDMIREKAEEIIYYYNADPNNSDKPKLDFDTYMNNALHLMNSQMPAKYSDRELYEQILQTEKIEAENKSIIEEIKREEVE